MVPEEEVELLGGDGKGRMTRQETELNYRGLRCMAPCTHDEGSIQAFRDIASLLSKIFVDRDLVPKGQGEHQSEAGWGDEGSGRDQCVGEDGVLK